MRQTRWPACFTQLPDNFDADALKPAGPTRQAFFGYYKQIYDSFAGQK
jgi:hypothetical protein